MSRDLEIIMNAHLISVPISAEFNQKIHTEIFKYEPFSSDSFPQLLLDLESATRLHPSIFKEIEHTAKHLYQNLGEFSAFKYIHFSLRNMTHKARGHHEYRFDELILSWMERLQFVTLPNFFNRYPPTISTKLMELVRFLTEYRDNQDFCCLIFVQRRMTAFCLQQVLRLFPELEFLRIGVLIGHTRQGESMSMETMQQSTIVKDFKQGKINVLIATRIGEEGLDIPYCHLVIRYFCSKDSFKKL
jgi:ERCC4-related helicase